MPALIKYADFNGNVDLSCFEQQIFFLGKFDPKNQNCLFKMKNVTYTNSDMESPIVTFIYPALDLKLSLGQSWF